MSNMKLEGKKVHKICTKCKVQVTISVFFFLHRLLAVGSRDMTTRICAFEKFKNIKEYSIGGIKDTVVGAFFEEKSYDLCTVSFSLFTSPKTYSSFSYLQVPLLYYD